MSLFFSPTPPSYATERLDSQLASLSTLPVTLPPSTSTYQTSDASTDHLDPVLEQALRELSSSRLPSKERLELILESLALVHDGLRDGRGRDVNGILHGSSRTNASSSSSGARYKGSKSTMDQVVQVEVIARSVTILWKEVMDGLLRVALDLEAERLYWERVLSSRRAVTRYFVQTLPLRIYHALPPRSTLTVHSFTSLKLDALFPHSPSAALASLTSPFILTQREVRANLKALTHTRDSIANRIGILASQGPRWSSSDSQTVEMEKESDRVYSLLCQVLEVPPAPTGQVGGPLRRSPRSDIIVPPSASSSSSPSLANPASLLGVLTTDIPRSREKLNAVLTLHSRPGPLTRLWFPLLFLPPVLWTVVSTVSRNKEWMKEQVRNARETIKGFVVSWVWEPLEGIGKTMRGGGEGLGVAPTTVQSDQASLERMVLDLGRDYYHLSGPGLEALGEEVKKGDMQAVLRVYEKELQSPVKNALMGSLVRTLLIQVQKTKTDLSLSLLSLDHLLRSQQLTFAFVGVAPSVLILYGLGGWLRNVWRGEKRGKNRRNSYFNGIRDIERILLVAPKQEAAMSTKDRGLLIVAVSGMRAWAAGLSGTFRSSFLDDLRLVEDPDLFRGDKLRSIERIWRSWGSDGRRKA